MIRNVRRDNEFSLSDQKPETMTIANKRSKMENQQPTISAKSLGTNKHLIQHFFGGKGISVVRHG